jgi:hypothetical protein
MPLYQCLFQTKKVCQIDSRFIVSKFTIHAAKTTVGKKIPAIENTAG